MNPHTKYWLKYAFGEGNTLIERQLKLAINSFYGAYGAYNPIYTGPNVAWHGKDENKMTISELQKEAYETAWEKGWHVNTPDIGTQIALIHSELSEALEEIRNGYAVAEIYGESYYSDGVKIANKPSGFPIELADAVIRIMDTCEQNDIDLEKAIRIKMDYNKTRTYKHGGKEF